MSAPAVSILIVSWRTPDLLVECVGHALRAVDGSGERAEVVVVDNGSGDDSLRAVRDSGAPVTPVALPRNLGFAGGCNAGLARCRGEFVLLLNSDARLDAASLRAGLAALRAAPRAAVAGLALVHPNGRAQNAVHAFPGLLTELLPLFVLELAWPARFPSKRYRHARPIRVEAVQGAALLVRRAAIDEVGGLPEEYFFFLEETEWCWRFRDAGWDVLHVPEARVVHAAGASSKRVHPEATAIEFHRSLYRFLRARRGRLTCGVALGMRFARACISSVTHALLAPLSPRHRVRLRGRLAVAAWHLRGLPADAGLEGLAALDASRPTGDAPGPSRTATRTARGGAQ